MKRPPLVRRRDEDDDEAPRRRKPEREDDDIEADDGSRNWGTIILIAGACVLFVALLGTGYLWYERAQAEEIAREAAEREQALRLEAERKQAEQERLARQRLEDAPQTADRVEWVIKKTRLQLVRAEATFWRSSIAQFALPDDLAREEARLKIEFDLAEANLKGRWGRREKSLAELNPRRDEQAKKFVDEAEAFFLARLNVAVSKLMAELKQADARVEAEVPPVVIPPMPKFGPSRADEFARDEWELLMPAKIRAMQAERIAKVALLRQQRGQDIFAHHIATMHDLCMRGLKDREEMLRNRSD
jgi:hypothetical protein